MRVRVERPRSAGSLNQYLVKRLLAHIRRQERELLALPAKIRDIRMKMQSKFVSFKKQMGIMRDINKNYATLLDKFRAANEPQFRTVCDKSEEIVQLHRLLNQLMSTNQSEEQPPNETPPNAEPNADSDNSQE